MQEDAGGPFGRDLPGEPRLAASDEIAPQMKFHGRFHIRQGGEYILQPSPDAYRLREPVKGRDAAVLSVLYQPVDACAVAPRKGVVNNGGGEGAVEGGVRRGHGAGGRSGVETDD